MFTKLLRVPPSPHRQVPTLLNLHTNLLQTPRGFSFQKFLSRPDNLPRTFLSYLLHSSFISGLVPVNPSPPGVTGAEQPWLEPRLLLENLDLQSIQKPSNRTPVIPVRLLYWLTHDLSLYLQHQLKLQSFYFTKRYNFLQFSCFYFEDYELFYIFNTQTTSSYQRVRSYTRREKKKDTSSFCIFTDFPQWTERTFVNL